MMWTQYDRLNKLYGFYLASLVSIDSIYDLSIDAQHRNLPNRSKVELLNALFQLYST